MPRPEFRKFSPAIRDKALTLAREIGVAKAATKFKVSRSRLTTWRQASGDATPRPAARTGTEARAMARLLPAPETNGSRHYHSAEEKARALEISEQIGVPAASTQLGIPAARLYKWKRATTKRQSYTPHPAWIEGFRAGFAAGKES